MIRAVTVLVLLNAATVFGFRTHMLSMKVCSDAKSSLEVMKLKWKDQATAFLSVSALVGAAAAVNADVLSAEERARVQPPNKYTDVSPSKVGKNPDFQAVRADIEQIIKDKPDKGPTIVRLAWHSSGTYDKMTKTGGSGGGTIRFAEELAHGANAGLDNPISWLEPVYKKYNKNTDLSYADLYTLAGVVAVSTMGGPNIPWRAGRQDEFDPSKVTPDGRLPAADKGSPAKTAAGLREVFNRMGFNDQEIVALSGAHALGRCHVTASGYVGPWTFTPTVFDNQYFTLLSFIKWTPNPKSPKFQYQDPTGKLMMLPSDLVLIEDSGFKKYVDLYAKDKKLFFKDFSAAFQKLEELGTSNLYDV